MAPRSSTRVPAPPPVPSFSSSSEEEEISSGEEEEEEELDEQIRKTPNKVPKLYTGVGVSTMEDFVIKRGLDTYEGAKKLEIEEKWAKLEMDELELFIRRNELILKQAKCLLARYKSV